MPNQKKGIYLILISTLCFSLMAMSVKLLGDLPNYEKIFFRNLTGLIISLIILKKKNIPLIGNNKKLLLFRSIFGLLGVASYFYSLSALPLSNAVILNKMSPIFVLIFASLFLSEKIKKMQIPALMISLIGVVLIIKPGLGGDLKSHLIGLSSAIFAGCAYTIIRKLRLSDSSESIVFYFCLFSTIAMIPFILIYGWTTPQSAQWIYVILLGLFATCAQFAMTQAYRYAPAGELAIYSYANIIFSTILGIIIWSEIPDFWSIVGGAAIMLGGYINFLANKNNTSRPLNIIKKQAK